MVKGNLLQVKIPRVHHAHDRFFLTKNILHLNVMRIHYNLPNERSPPHIHALDLNEITHVRFG